MQDTPTSFLYRAESRGIQAWILGSDRLAELAGGSAAIEDLTDRAAAAARDVGGQVIAAAAGGITVLFDDASALARFRAWWPLVADTMAPGLEAPQAWVPRSGAGVFDRLERALQAARQELAPQLPVPGPLNQRALRTGRPAVGRGKKDGFEDRVIERKLWAHKERGVGLDRQLLGEEVAQVWKTTTEARDFGEGHVAVVHVDGDRVGELFRRCGDDIDEWQRLSAKLREIAEAALRQAAHALVEVVEVEEQGGRVDEEDGRRPVPLRPVVAGGDDLTVLISARYAIPFAVCLMEAFETEARERGLRDLTVAAGVAMARNGWPFHAMHALASSLVKAAKRARPSGHSRLLLHRVTTPGTREWGEIVDRELTVDGEVVVGQGRYRATLLGGPFTLRGMRALDALCAQMDRVPRGPLREWAAVVRRSPGEGEQRWARLREVLGQEGCARLDERLAALGVQPGRPWRVEDDHAQTPLAEAMTWRSVQRASGGTRLWGTR